MQSTKKALLRYLRSDDLLQSILVLGKIEKINFSHTHYIDKVLNLASRILGKSHNIQEDPVLLVQAINQVLFEELKLPGRTNRYKKVIDDASLYYLHRLLDDKKGGPLSYTVLYYILAQQVGLPCEVVAFPSHYFLKVQDVTGDFYINPFEKGKVLSPADFQRRFRTVLQRNRLLSTKLFEKASVRQLVTRMAQQLKHVYILKNKPLQALRAVELLTALFPDSPELTRDRGILYCEMEYFSQAARDLKYYLQERPKAEDFREIRKLALYAQGVSGNDQLIEGSASAVAFNSILFGS